MAIDNTQITKIPLIIALLMAGASGNQTVMLNELLSEASLANPEIIAAQAELKAARRRTSGFLFIPDPVVSVEYSDPMQMYSISQNMPYPGKLLTQSDIALNDVDIYQAYFDMKKLDILTALKKTYARLFLVHKKIATTTRSIAFLKQLHSVSIQKYATGTTPQSDVLRATIELARAETDLLSLIDEKQVIEIELNKLLNRPLEAPVGTPDTLPLAIIPLNSDSLYKIARFNEPGLKAYAYMVRRAQARRTLMGQNYFPDIMFRFTQQVADNSTVQKYMVGITLPLWSWGKQHQQVREMDAHIEMAEAAYEAKQKAVLLSVEQARVSINDKNRRADLYLHTIIPQAEANVRSALTAYEADRVDFLNVLEGEKVLVQAELEYYRAQSELFSAIADLERTLGTRISN